MIKVTGVFSQLVDVSLIPEEDLPLGRFFPGEDQTGRDGRDVMVTNTGDDRVARDQVGVAYEKKVRDVIFSVRESTICFSPKPWKVFRKRLLIEEEYW